MITDPSYGVVDFTIFIRAQVEDVELLTGRGSLWQAVWCPSAVQCEDVSRQRRDAADSCDSAWD